MINRQIIIYGSVFALAVLGLLKSDFPELFSKKETIPAYPGFVSQTYVPSASQETDASKRGKEVAIAALQVRFDEPKSVWKRSSLDKYPKLKEALDAFMNEKRAQSIRTLSLVNREPEELHIDLLKRGFAHERHPLFAGKNKEKIDMYWRRDGTKTQDPTEPNLVPHDIYVHEDGGLVRVKPEGVPNPSGKSPRPQPHVTKSVLEDLTLVKKDGVVKPDTDFRNEAFKVTEDNRPVPKTPAKYGGMYIPKDLNKEEANGYIGYLMDQVHFDLKRS